MTEALIAMLAAKCPPPAAWEQLFTTDNQLIRARARRLSLTSTFPNPSAEGKPNSAFVSDDAGIPVVNDLETIETFLKNYRIEEFPRFIRAGERREYRRNPACIQVGLLAAGGPGSGINQAIDAATKRYFTLATLAARGHSHRARIRGYRAGYLGLGQPDWDRWKQDRSKPLRLGPPRYAWLWPSPSVLRSILETMNDRERAEREKGRCDDLFTDEWSTEGGVKIGSSRDTVLTDEQADALATAHALRLKEEGLDVLHVIGGDGTFKWAARVCARLAHLAPEIAIIGGAKTMDNDLNFSQSSYGFSTAVANGAEFIRTIHAGAESMGRLGVIELFGAGSGFVTLHAANISGVADCVLMPELAGVQTPDRVRAHLLKRIKKNGHAVFVVAEGAVKGFAGAITGTTPAAGRPGFAHGGAEQKAEAFDRILAWLKQEVSKGLVDARARYLMRDTAPNAADLELAKWSGKLLADTGLAGFSDCAVQAWQGEYVLVPFEAATARLKCVAPWNYYLQTLLDRERLAMSDPPG